MMNLVLKMMNVALKLMNFVLKLMNFASKGSQHKQHKQHHESFHDRLVEDEGYEEDLQADLFGNTQGVPAPLLLYAAGKTSSNLIPW